MFSAGRKPSEARSVRTSQIVEKVLVKLIYSSQKGRCKEPVVLGKEVEKQNISFKYW